MKSVVLALALLQLHPPERPWPWQEFVWVYYVADNSPYKDGYPKRAANRFRLLWDAQVAATLPESEPYVSYLSRNGHREVRTETGDSPVSFRPFVPTEAFDRALAEFLECRPDLAPLKSEIYIAERVTSAAGTFTTAFLERSLEDSDSYVHLVTIAYRGPSGCAATSEQPATIDLSSRIAVDEHGGYDRRVWDVLWLRGRQYLVTLQEDYEYRCFQVYRVRSGALEPVAHVPIACLGCE
jgi:hypothetical protein